MKMYTDGSSVAMECFLDGDPVYYVRCYENGLIVSEFRDEITGESWEPFNPIPVVADELFHEMNTERRKLYRKMELWDSKKKAR